MWSHEAMIDFAIAELLDGYRCALWREHHLHSKGLKGVHCRSPEPQLCRAQGRGT
jgi:hypothetical protein